jgi:hypothetical protein
MRTQLAALLAATALLGFPACGGDDGNGGDEPAKQDTTERTTTTEAQADPAVKAELQKAITGYNRGFSRFRQSLNNIRGDLDRLKTYVSNYRDVIYEFDADLRAIDFPDDLVIQVNNVLENNRTLISHLDAIGNADDFNQAINLYDRFAKVRAPTVRAVNRILDQL